MSNPTLKVTLEIEFEPVDQDQVDYLSGTLLIGASSPALSSSQIKYESWRDSDLKQYYEYDLGIKILSIKEIKP